MGYLPYVFSLFLHVYPHQAAVKCLKILKPKIKWFMLQPKAWNLEFLLYYCTYFRYSNKTFPVPSSSMLSFMVHHKTGHRCHSLGLNTSHFWQAASIVHLNFLSFRIHYGHHTGTCQVTQVTPGRCQEIKIGSGPCEKQTTWTQLVARWTP